MLSISTSPKIFDKIFDRSKLKVFVDDKINVTKELKFVLGREEKIVGKAFSPFPTIFSKAFLL